MVSARAVRPGLAAANPWLRRLGALGIAAGATFLVVLPVGHVTAVRSISFGLALIAAVAVWAAAGYRRVPLLPAFGVWLAAASLSLLWTHDMQASLKAIQGDVVRSFAVFFIFHTLTRYLPSYRAWVAATALGFVALSTLALFSFLEHREWVSHFVPALGDFATAANTVLPLLVGYLVLAPRWTSRNWRIEALVAAAIVATLWAGYFTYSRAFWLVLVCGALLAAALYSARGRRLGRRTVLVVALISAAGVGLAMMVSAQRRLDVTHFSERAVIYSAVAHKILRSPLTGTGYGHETDKPWYRSAMPAGSSVFHAHSIVLSYLDQMGVLGLLVLAAIFGAPARLLARAYRAPSPAVSGLGISGLVLLASVFVKNNLDYFFFDQNLWLLFAHAGIYLGQVGRLATMSGPAEADAPGPV